MDLNNAHVKYMALAGSCKNYKLKQHPSSAECAECKKVAEHKVSDNVLSCHKHRVIVCDKNDVPYSITHVFSQSNKNGSLYWARDNHVTVTLSDGSTKNVSDFIIQAKVSVSEKAKYGVSDGSCEIQSRFKILECNPLLMAYLNKYSSQRHMTSIGVESDTLWDNTISLDKVFYCKETYLKDAILYVGSGAGSKKVRFLTDYLMCGRGKHSNGKCKKFKEMKNVTCQASISPVLLSISKTKIPETSPQHVKKSVEVTCSKIHFGINWVRCNDTVTSKTIDENGDEITVETPSLMLDDSSNDSDSDSKVDTSKMIRGVPKAKGKTQADKLLSYDSGKEDSDQSQSDDEEEEVVVKKKVSKKPQKVSKKPKKPVVILESEASSTEEEFDHDSDEEDFKKTQKVSSVWASTQKKSKKSKK